MASSKYFGRAYRITFLKGNGGTIATYQTEDGKPAMDIKFDVTYALGQTARFGTVSILGLSHEHISDYIKLATMDRGAALSQHMRVKLEVGYFSGGGKTVEVLNGFVYYATVTSPPQMWLNMNISEYDPQGSTEIVMPKVASNVTIGRYLTEITDAISDKEDGEGIDCTWEDKTEDQVVESDEEIITIELNEKEKLGGIIDKLNKCYAKAQFLLRCRAEDNFYVIEAHDKDATKASRGTVNVDSDHGLLSVSGLDPVGGCVTTFIDGNARDELCRLNLKSKLNPQANGTYLIIKKQYVGHFMGQEWYTRYFCSARED